MLLLLVVLLPCIERRFIQEEVKPNKVGIGNGATDVLKPNDQPENEKASSKYRKS